MRSMCTATGESLHIATKSQHSQKERERKIVVEKHHILLPETWSMTVLWFVILQFQPPFGPKLKSLRVGLGVPGPTVCQVTQAQWTWTRRMIVLETHGGSLVCMRVAGLRMGVAPGRQSLDCSWLQDQSVVPLQFLTSCLPPERLFMLPSTPITLLCLSSLVSGNTSSRRSSLPWTSQGWIRCFLLSFPKTSMLTF